MTELKELGLQSLSFNMNDNITETLYAQEGDLKSRGLDIRVLHKNEPADLTGVTMKLFATPKDNEIYCVEVEEIDATKGHFRVIYPSDILQPGIVLLLLRLYKNGAILNNKKFKLLVGSGLATDTAIEGHDSYPVFEKLLEVAESEDKRINAENKRKASEEERISNENERKTDEITRVENEDARKLNESDRKLNEETRNSNENTRIENENVRKVNEDDRVSNEGGRVSNEETRKAEEGIRVENEITRQSSEENRQVNEETRKSNENIRIDNENRRVEAESKREERILKLENEKADKVKVAVVEKELNDYKNTISSININQEAKQTASGYGIVSLPPNAANGQVSVSVKGNTRTNLVRGGNNDLEAWGGTEKKIEDGWYKAVGSIESSAQFGQRDIILQPNTTYTFSALLKQVGTATARLNIRVVDDNDERYTYHLFGSNDTKREYVTFKTPDTIQVAYIWVYVVEGETLYFKDVLLEEGKEVKNYISGGTKSTVSAMKITSENEDKTEKSQAYIIAKDKDNKIVNLNSLPNGTKDEIRLSEGILVKRVGVDEVGQTYPLEEPKIIPIQVAGNIILNPNGTIYIDHATFVTDIYTENGLHVLYSDLPIKIINKIAKIDYTTGTEHGIDTSKAIVSEDKLSFTHEDLTEGDIVFFNYDYDVESTDGETTIEYYDSRYTIKDSVTGKFYKWNIAVADGQPSIELKEV